MIEARSRRKVREPAGDDLLGGILRRTGATGMKLWWAYSQ
jgi:hypothetical protein